MVVDLLLINQFLVVGKTRKYDSIEALDRNKPIYTEILEWPRLKWMVFQSWVSLYVLQYVLFFLYLIPGLKKNGAKIKLKKFHIL